mmetsp:Transcript_5530/g.13843  ORF Transcript_5530/g.13843 Transcript_5530/m.13843 type:complete len:688 (-) Transcript_5530:569-2632(-)|eukprot:CAMPEP_0178994476 /NCGR_PEP_ID=MMETSP0795-20121207/7290_1 /TAXON_ID=88552 /ORGANISM="Amoebophrya sp., Strain Ameob2" /LENGTH=687 /DNA_ID=CAMNT_0020686671 /DNA_START=199 /DNA_END=2262 /DNA_ORIENTATION=-
MATSAASPVPTSPSAFSVAHHVEAAIAPTCAIPLRKMEANLKSVCSGLLQQLPRDEHGHVGLRATSDITLPESVAKWLPLVESVQVVVDPFVVVNSGHDCVSEAARAGREDDEKAGVTLASSTSEDVDEQLHRPRGETRNSGASAGRDHMLSESRSGNVVLTASTPVYCYHLCDEEAADIFEGGSSRKATSDEADPPPELPLTAQWFLPHRKFSGLWESLIFEDLREIRDEKGPITGSSRRRGGTASPGPKLDLRAELAEYVKSCADFDASTRDATRAELQYQHLLPRSRLILLCGPPGTGKTSLCRALAQKLAVSLNRRSCLTTSSANKHQEEPLHESEPRAQLIEVNAHSLFSRWFSESGKIVLKLFEKVFRLALDAPGCVFFVLLDEVESLCMSRQHCLSTRAEPSDSVRAVNAVLTQIDRAASHHPNVFLLATSNLKDSLDPAFLDRCDVVKDMGMGGEGEGSGTMSAAVCRGILRSGCLQLMKQGLLFVAANKSTKARSSSLSLRPGKGGGPPGGVPGTAPPGGGVPESCGGNGKRRASSPSSPTGDEDPKPKELSEGGGTKRVCVRATEQWSTAGSDGRGNHHPNSAVLDPKMVKALDDSLRLICDEATFSSETNVKTWSARELRKIPFQAWANSYPKINVTGSGAEGAGDGRGFTAGRKVEIWTFMNALSRRIRNRELLE